MGEPTVTSETSVGSAWATDEMKKRTRRCFKRAS
jgi:hypothetical protein